MLCFRLKAPHLFRKDFSYPIRWNLQPYKKVPSSEEGELRAALVSQHTLPDFCRDVLLRVQLCCQEPLQCGTALKERLCKRSFVLNKISARPFNIATAYSVLASKSPVKEIIVHYRNLNTDSLLNLKKHISPHTPKQTKKILLSLSLKK